MEAACQIWIVLLGCAAIWLVGRLEHWRRWGYVCGLLSQPAWIYSALAHDQWGILAISLWYTYAWSQGIYNHWIGNEGGVMEGVKALHWKERRVKAWEERAKKCPCNFNAPIVSREPLCSVNQGKCAFDDCPFAHWGKA